MSVQSLYSGILKGGIATTGNTLGLWGRYDPPNPNVQLDTSANGIGAFTSTNTALQFDGYPSGTTADWTQNSSSNSLIMPPGSTIIRAFLFYGGTSINAVQNVNSIIATTPVGLTTPSGAFYSILPTYTESLTQ